RCRIADMNDVSKRRVFRFVRLRLEQQNHPLDAHGESARGCRFAAELFEQSVVTAAAGHRSLRAQTIGDPLEHGAVVVIEPAYETWIDGERNAGIVEKLPDVVEVRAGSGLEAIDQSRRAGDQLLQ